MLPRAFVERSSNLLGGADMAELGTDGFLGVALERGHRAGVRGPAPTELPSITYVEEVATGRTYAISPEIQTVLGYAQEEWMGDAELWINRIHPDDRDRVVDACDHANAVGEEYSEEYRMVARDGRLVWIRDEAVLVRDSEGGPLCWQGVMQVIPPPE
jgi:PAS domain S-box-containing protein